MSQQFWQTNTALAKQYESQAVSAKLPLLPGIELVNRSGVLTAPPPLKILDNACGPAVLTELILNQLSDEQKAGDNVTILCADIGPAMIEAAKEKIQKNGWQGVSAQVIDQQDLSSLPDNSFTHVLTGLGINFVKDADSVLKDMHRILKPGGTIAFSTWETVGWIQYIIDTFKTVPGAPPFPNQEEGFSKIQNGNKWEDKAWIKEHVSKYFTSVEVIPAPAVHEFTTEEFLGTFGGPIVLNMLNLFWDKENADKYGGSLAPAMREMFKKQGVENIELQMDALITVAKKA